MGRKGIISILSSLAVVCLLFAACAKAPQEKPEGAPEKEPTITLYMADKGEKKEMKMEEYIAGVVAGEMKTDWPVNTLAAQAILARTFTMSKMDEGKKYNGADATTDHKKFQAYDQSKINDRVKEAVKKSRGKVATFEEDYIKGWFSACCGGITASAREAGLTKEKNAGYIKPEVKDDCLSITTAENKHWKAKVPLSKVRSAVSSNTGKDPGRISSARITKKGPSGRASKIKLGEETINGYELRKALGPSKMRSTLLTEISVQGDSLVMEGKGFGHGVGMCQWGAKKMAQDGKSPEDIVKFYYKNVQVQKLWD